MIMNHEEEKENCDDNDNNNDNNNYDDHDGDCDHDYFEPFLAAALILTPMRCRPHRASSRASRLQRPQSFPDGRIT